MYVCICNAVTDKQIKQELSNGAQNLYDLQERLGVATCCGSCADCTREIIGKHHEEKSTPFCGISLQAGSI